MDISGLKIFPPKQPLRLTSKDKPGDKFILLLKRGPVLILTLSKDRLLYDDTGHGFACVDEELMVDTVSRTGVGFFSLPENHWSEEASRVHDFLTSCKAYQLNHGRSEAEKVFEDLLEAISDTTTKKVVSAVLSRISKLSSWFFWDNPATRWKTGRK